MSSVNNTKYGVSTLKDNTGSDNTAVGAYTLINNSNANHNSAVGSNAMYYNTTGDNNTSIGSGSLCNNTTGKLNTAVGSSALEGLVTTGSNVGDENVAVGVQALYNSNGGSQNTAIGSYSLYHMEQGNSTTALGYNSGYHDVSGSYNTYLGASTDVSNNGSTPYNIYEYSTAIGYGALINASNQIMMGGNLNGQQYPTVIVPGPMDASAIYLPDTKPFNSYAENEVVPKSYVDTASQGLSVKAPCNCIATGQSYSDSTSLQIDFSNNGYTYTLPITIDGYDLSANSTPPNQRVLFNNQGTPDTSANVLNGIYDVSGNSTLNSITFVRSGDMPNGSDALGAYTFIQYGTEHAKSSWVQNQRIDSSGTPVVVGVNPLFFVQFNSIDYKLGRGLELEYVNPYTYLSLDTSLNAVNYLDNNYSITDPIQNQGSNTGTINIGAYTQQINIGGANQLNQINITGNVDISGNVDVSGNVVVQKNVTVDGSLNVLGYASFSHDISVNSLTVGLGSGNISTNTTVGYQALKANTTGSSNVAIGYDALFTNSTGSNNVAIGYQALNKNTSGSSNTAIGYQALNKNQTGSNNTAIGYSALYTNSGSSNTAIGYQALLNNLTGSNNVAIGQNAMYYNKSGSNNTAIGLNALYRTTGSNSVAIGYQALVANISGSSNTAIGYNALDNNKPGSSNTAIGYSSGSSDLSGNYNTYLGANTDVSNVNIINYSTALGYRAIIDSSNQIVLGTSTEGVYMPGDYLKIGTPYTRKGFNNYALDVLGNVNFTGNLDVSGNFDISGNVVVQKNVTVDGSLNVLGYASFSHDISVNSLTVGLGSGNISTNTTVGYQALKANTTGSSNVAIGYDALFTNSTGSNNVAIGYYALNKNTSGSSNTAIGYQALYPNTTGQSNTAIGYQALKTNSSGSSNTAIGFDALLNNSTGSNNVAIGQNAMYYNGSGSNNTAIGLNALLKTTGSNNTAIGYQALVANISGSSNTAIGFDALDSNKPGLSNTAIGYMSGSSDLSGNYNTYLGANTDVSNVNIISYSTALGYKAIIDSSNQIVLGTSTEGVYMPGDYLKIGGTYTRKGFNNYALDVLGNVNFTGNLDVSGNITGVNNIDVTTINGALYPPAVTGAGTVVSANNIQINLSTGTQYLVAQVAVTAGTWTIDLLLPLSFPSGTTTLFEQLWLQDAASPIPSTTVYWTVSDNRDTLLTSGGTNNWTRAWSVTYYFATSRTIYFAYQSNFSGASSTPFIPATPTGQYTMRATQIA